MTTASLDDVPHNEQPDWSPFKIALGIVVIVLSATVLFGLYVVLDAPWEWTGRNDGKTRWSKAQTEMGEIVKALQRHALEHGGEYSSGLEALSDDFNGKVPLNPFTKKPYDYAPSGATFTLTCLGKDNLPGGEKLPDRDIVFKETGYVDNPQDNPP